MNGDCGIFYDGDRQVGGCYSWVVDTKLGVQPSDKWKNFKVLSRSIKTERWWLFENITAFTVKLYEMKGDDLIYANSADIKSIVVSPFELGEEQSHELLMKF
jgi:hypothetical protein